MATRINDVTTDLDDPPKFRHADIGDMPDDVKAVIRQHYPDLQPLVLAGVDPTSACRTDRLSSLAMCYDMLCVTTAEQSP